MQIDYGLGLKLFKSWLRLGEVTAPTAGQVADNSIAIYAKDKAGVAAPYWTDDADVEHEFVDAASAGPSDADYLVKTAHADLTAERVVTDGTSITADWATPAQVTFKRAALTGDVTASADSNATTIANDAVTTAKILDANVTNAKLANMAAWTFKARNNSGSGVPQDVALADVAEEASPASGDYLVAFDSTGAIRKINWSNISSSSGGEASGHVHSLTRLVADGVATVFNLLDFLEYIDTVHDGGSLDDELNYTLSSDGGQITFGSAPTAGHILHISGVAKSL